MLPNLNELKKLRKQHNLTQTQLSKLSGVSQSLIAKVEGGRIDPTYSKVNQLYEVIESLDDKVSLKARDVAVKKIISVERQSPISIAIKKMRDHNISQIPVIENKAVFGMVSETDIINLIAEGADTKKLRVGEVMEDAPPVLSSSTPLHAIANLLRYTPLVLISEKGSHLGILTKSDVLNAVYRK